MHLAVATVDAFRPFQSCFQIPLPYYILDLQVRSVSLFRDHLHVFLLVDTKIVYAP